MEKELYNFFEGNSDVQVLYQHNDIIVVKDIKHYNHAPTCPTLDVDHGKSKRFQRDSPKQSS